MEKVKSKTVRKDDTPMWFTRHRELDFHGKLPVLFKVSYALGNFGDSMILLAGLYYMMLFFTDYVGVGPAAVGLALMVQRLWDAVTDPAMGAISDRTRSRFGRRRPWLLWGCIPLALTWLMIWFTPADRGLLTITFMYAAVLLGSTARTVVTVPYLTLSSELTSDYDERTSLQAYRVAFANVGRFFGASFLFFALLFDNPRVGFAVVAGIYGLVTAACYFLAFLGIRENPDAQTESQPSLFSSCAYVLRNGPYVVLCVYFFLALLATSFNSAFLVYIIKYYLLKPEATTSLLITTQVVSLVLLPLWVRIAGSIGKKRANIAAITLGGLVQLSAFLLLGRGTLLPAFIWAAAMGIPAASMQLFPFSLAAETVDLDELETGTRKAGLYYGIVTFLFKSAFALGAAITGLALEWSGFIANQDQTTSTLLQMRVFHAVIPGSMLLLSALLFAALFPIGKEQAVEIRRKLREQRANGASSE